MLKCAIVGAGNIGCGTNQETPTHARSYFRNPNTQLVGIIDNDSNTLIKSSETWNTIGYPTIDKMMEKVKPDIVSICVPDMFHEDVLSELIQYKPKLIVIEKPMTVLPEITEKLITLCQLQEVKLLANYSRRYLPTYYWLRDICREQKVISATIKYNKGVIHNGCHAIDLARLLFGEVLSWKILSTKNDYSESDPSVSAYLCFEYCQDFFLQALDTRYCTHFELDIITESQRFIIDNDHERLREFVVKTGCGNPPGKRFVESATSFIDHSQALDLLVEHAVSILNKRENLIFSAEEALKSEKIAYTLAKNS